MLWWVNLFIWMTCRKWKWIEDLINYRSLNKSNDECCMFDTYGVHRFRMPTPDSKFGWKIILTPIHCLFICLYICIFTRLFINHSLSENGSSYPSIMRIQNERLWNTVVKIWRNLVWLTIQANLNAILIKRNINKGTKEFSFKSYYS